MNEKTGVDVLDWLLQIRRVAGHSQATYANLRLANDGFEVGSRIAELLEAAKAVMYAFQSEQGLSYSERNAICRLSDSYISCTAPATPKEK